MNSTTTTVTAPKKVTIIPASKSLHPDSDNVRPTRKKRVAAYCRVSTLLEEQQGSYNLQERYYENLINNNPEWEPAGVYGDEGKSGTTLKGRTGFLQMMDDVRAGKIDYIITKATSRFGRNNSEFISILDELESYGVEVLFESEGIVTSGHQNRTILQMLGVSNEYYSSSLSNNVRWSKERKMRSGKVTFCYKTFLGYEKGKDGEPKIVEEQAKIVRLIYQLFLEDKPYAYIAKYLTEHHIPTPAGKQKWLGHTVESILTNEKYTGDAQLQKTFRWNYLDKKAKVNQGERPRIIVENNHPAIIDKATFAKVQELVKARSRNRNSGTAQNPFSGKIVCADCGEYYGHKTWHSRGRITYSVWTCNHKYTDETAYSDARCKSANLRQEWIEQGYIYAMNQLLSVRSEILAKYERKLTGVKRRLDSGRIEKELKILNTKNGRLGEEVALLKGEQEFRFRDQSESYIKEANLKDEMEEIAKKIYALEAKRNDLNAEKKVLETFIKTFKAMPEVMSRFKDKDFTETVEKIVVNQTTLTFHFYGGECLKVAIALIKE